MKWSSADWWQGSGQGLLDPGSLHRSGGWTKIRLEFRQWALAGGGTSWLMGVSQLFRRWWRFGGFGCGLIRLRQGFRPAFCSLRNYLSFAISGLLVGILLGSSFCYNGMVYAAKEQLRTHNFLFGESPIKGTNRSVEVNSIQFGFKFYSRYTINQLCFILDISLYKVEKISDHVYKVNK